MSGSYDFQDAPLIEVDEEMLLLTDYLARELDPAGVAEVERRLAEDERFRRRAAPLIALYSIPPRWKREPMPSAVFEKHWDDFTRRAGFTFQRRKRRWRWLVLAVALLVLGKVLFDAVFEFVPTSQGIRVAVQWEPALQGPGGFNLNDGSRVDLDRGARLVQAKKVIAGSFPVRLQGSGTFHVRPDDHDFRELIVLSRTARAAASGASFRVRSSADTTEIEVYRLAPRVGRTAPVDNQVVLRDIGSRLTPDVVRAGESRLVYGNILSVTSMSHPGIRIDYSDASRGRAPSGAPTPPDARAATPDSATSMVLADGTMVTLAPGATLSAWTAVGGYWLSGTARFQKANPGAGLLVIHTAAATFLLPRGDLRLSSSGDTATAVLHAREYVLETQRLSLPPDRLVVLSGDGGSDIAQLQMISGESLRWVRGQRPVVTSAHGDEP